jgi:hypothetical protein
MFKLSRWQKKTRSQWWMPGERKQLQLIWGKAVSSVKVTVHEQCGGDQGWHIPCRRFKQSSEVQQIDEKHQHLHPKNIQDA